MPSVAAARRHDLTDSQWAALQPLLPAETGRGRPRRWASRDVIDGIRWRIRAGTPWRDVPETYAPWQTLYRWFRRWQRDGTWARVLAGLQAAADADKRIDWRVSVDSTVSRAHQHAAGARRDGHLQKEPPGGVRVEPDDHGLGRSRGGFTTKTHLACEQGRKTLSLVITAGQRGDSPQLTTVLDQRRLRRDRRRRPAHLHHRRPLIDRRAARLVRRPGQQPPPARHSRRSSLHATARSTPPAGSTRLSAATGGYVPANAHRPAGWLPDRRPHRRLGNLGRGAP